MTRPVATQLISNGMTSSVACDSKRSVSRTAYFRYVQWAPLVAKGSIALVDEGPLCTKDNKGQCARRSPPGNWSSQRHRHSDEDEFVYVLEGELTLIEDGGRTLQNIEERGELELSRTASFGTDTIRTSLHGGVVALQRLGNTNINGVLIRAKLGLSRLRPVDEVR
jgi:hypothetical protein